MVVEYDPDNDKTMQVQDAGDCTARAFDLAVSNNRNTLTSGTEAEVKGSIGGAVTATYDTNEDRFLIAYFDAQGRSKVADIDPGDDSISFGSEVQYESGTVRGLSSCFDDAQARVLLAYEDDSNSDYGTAIVAEIDNSDDSHAYGTAVVFESASIQHTSCVHDANANKNVIFYKDGGNSDRLTAIVGTIDNTDNSISFGTAVAVDTTSGAHYTSMSSGSYYDANATKVVVSWINVTTQFAYARVGTISGTDISFGNLATIDASTHAAYGSGSTTSGPQANAQAQFRGVTCAYDPDNNKGLFLLDPGNLNNNAPEKWQHYGSTGSFNPIMACLGTISGTTISFTTPTLVHPFLEPRGVMYADQGITDPYVASMTYDTTADAMIVAIEPQSGNPVLLVGNYPYDNQMDKFIGFNTGAVSDAATATITVTGGLNENQTSLTVGETYYIDSQGFLEASPAWLNPAHVKKAGVATAATKLLVQGHPVDPQGDNNTWM
jgi:hypothetical protein